MMKYVNGVANPGTVTRAELVLDWNVEFVAEHEL